MNTKQILAYLIFVFFFQIKKILSAQDIATTYAPGFLVYINGVIEQMSNISETDQTNCPANCASCINDQVCTSCLIGYFLHSPAQNNNVYCVQCPLFDPANTNSDIQCADCITQPFSWDEKKTCTFNYIRNTQITDTTYDAYIKKQDLSTQKLYEVFSTDGLTIQVKEFVGGEIWCGGLYEVDSCKPRDNINSDYYDFQQLQVKCRQGFFFEENQCKTCKQNCARCRSSDTCDECVSGYLVYLHYDCKPCSQFVPNCASCYLGNADSIIQFLQIQDLNPQYMTDNHIEVRCTSCSQTTADFLIPSLDLLSCENCLDLSNCQACRYAVVNDSILYDHTKKPIVVQTGSNFKKYCLQCEDQYFVSYNGLCEQCVFDTSVYTQFSGYRTCETCYYGSTGVNAFYTLQQDFIYLSDPGDLVKKCYECPYEITQNPNYPANQYQAILLNGTCKGFSFLYTADPQCSKWKQIIPDFEFVSGFECIECKGGYGFDASKSGENRKCDRPATQLNLYKCESFIYTLKNMVPQLVTCTKCEEGFIATPSKGCISCSLGIPVTVDNKDTIQSNCKKCSLLSPSGFNFTEYLLTQPTQYTREKLIQIENKYSLAEKPFCQYCYDSGSSSVKKVYNKCKNLCYSSLCYNVNNGYNACEETQSGSYEYQCKACFKTKFQVFWNSNQALSFDKQGCSRCTHFCSSCIQLSLSDVLKQNPYFQLSDPGLQPYLQQCLKCRTIDDICNDYVDTTNADLGGFRFRCPDKANYVMYYDNSINQCNPCPKDNPICSRVVKIRQIIDCRPIDPNRKTDTLKAAETTTAYYAFILGDGVLDTFIDPEAILTYNWNPSQPLEISFSDLNDVNGPDGKNLSRYMALNEENISSIEFEILLIPNKKTYKLLDETTERQDVNVCEFDNDLEFSTRIAQHIPKIKKLQFTFKTLDLINSKYIIGQSEIDIIAKGMSFEGWQTYKFQNINFIPVYNVQATDSNVREMFFDFSKNLFKSNLILNTVQFLSGMSLERQITLNTKFKTNPYASIDMTSFEQVTVTNSRIVQFYYPQNSSIFKFSSENSNLVSSLNFQMTDSQISGSQFEKTTLILIQQPKVIITLTNVNFFDSKFTSTSVIQQMSGQTNQLYFHQINLDTVKFEKVTLEDSVIVDTYNIFKISIKMLKLYPSDEVKFKSSQNSALITANVIEGNDITISSYQDPNNPDVKVKQQYDVRIFQLPHSSESQLKQVITLKKTTIEYVKVQTDGFLVKLQTFNSDNNLAQLFIDDLSLNTIIGTSLNYYIISAVQSKYAKLENINLIDLFGCGFFQGSFIEEVYTKTGKVTRSQSNISPWNSIDKPNLESIGIQYQNGQIFYLKNMRTRLFISNYDFTYQYFIDKSLISIEHLSKDETDKNQTPSLMDDDIFKTYVQQLYEVDLYSLLTQSVVINECTFKDVGVNIINSNIQSSLIKLSTTIQYRLIIQGVSISNVKSYTSSNFIFKDSSAILLVDSKDSSVLLNKFKLYYIRTQDVQGSCLINSDITLIKDGEFTQSNEDKVFRNYIFKGGFFNILSSKITITGSKFQQGLADQGGALYIKGFNNIVVTIDTCTFNEGSTTLMTSSTGLGGAISIESPLNGMTLKIVNSFFTQNYALYKGGVLHAECGEAICTIEISGTEFKNNFATSGSLFNIKYIFAYQRLTFSKNLVSFKFDDPVLLGMLLSSFNYRENIDNGVPNILSQLQQHYNIVIEGGSFTFKDNIFKDLIIFQGLLLANNLAEFNDSNNKYSNSKFTFTPFIYVLSSVVQLQEKLNIQDIEECIDCLANTSYTYLQKFITSKSFIMFANCQFIGNIEGLFISKVTCTQCDTGIVGVKQYTTNQKLIFNKAIISDNKSKYGSLFFLGKSTKLMRSRLLQANNDNIIIQDSNFSKNTAESGGAIYSSYYSLKLVKTTLTGNAATKFGGGIYFYTLDSLSQSIKLTDSSQIIQNTALVGGGLKISGSFLEIQTSSIVQGNTAIKAGSDVTSYPVAIKVYRQNLEQTYDQTLKAVILKDWVSGTSLNQALVFKLIGVDGRPQALDEGTVATLEVSLNYINEEAPVEAKIQGITTVNYDFTIDGFVLDKAIFQQYPLKALKIKAQSNMVMIPSYDGSGTLISVKKDYFLPLIFNMRTCIIGEAYIQSTGNCYLCEKGTYSITEGSKSCQDCPKYGVDACPGGANLNLSPGYWRPTETSDLIESCVNYPSNCKGELNIGDNSCSEGHVGALCEVCDIDAKQWGESYAHSGEYTCGKCKEVAGNTAKMVGLSLYTIIAIFFSVKSTKALLDSYILKISLMKAGFKIKKSSESKDSVGVIIKIFTTYIQLILVITTFKLQLPPGLNDFTVNIGDPVKQMSFSMDCGLKSSAGDIPMTYYRLVWSQLMPLIYTIGFIFLQFAFTIIKKQKPQLAVVWISFIYIYISMQPSIVKQNIQTISCRLISGEQYIKSNVSEKCYTSEHIKWSVLFILPTLLFWVILIPAYFFFGMYSQRTKLQTKKLQYKFGFLYTEYKLESYFWELVKIFQKTLVTIFINIFDQYSSIKGILVIFVVIIYIQMQIKYKPYLEKKFNMIDLQANIVVILSIIISIFIMDNPFAYQVWIGYILLVAINTFFIIKLLRILISQYTSIYETKIREISIKLSQKFPKLQKLLNLPKIPKERLNELWGFLRNKYIPVKNMEKNESLNEKQKVKQIHSDDQGEQIQIEGDIALQDLENQEHQEQQKSDDFGFLQMAVKTNQINVRPISSSSKKQKEFFTSNENTIGTPHQQQQQLYEESMNKLQKEQSIKKGEYPLLKAAQENDNSSSSSSGDHNLQSSTK